MDLKYIVIAVSAFGGLSGLAALINSLTNAKSSSMDNLKDLVDVLNAEITRLRKRICNLEEESKSQKLKIESLETKVTHWRNKYFELCDWVHETFGLEPFEDEEKN